MKRFALTFAAITLAGALVWMFAQAVATPPPLAALFPSGPLLYLEAHDFQSLLKDWNSVGWTTVRDMVLAWVVTLPASALLACIAYLIFTRVL